MYSHFSSLHSFAILALQIDCLSIQRTTNQAAWCCSKGVPRCRIGSMELVGEKWLRFQSSHSDPQPAPSSSCSRVSDARTFCYYLTFLRVYNRQRFGLCLLGLGVQSTWFQSTDLLYQLRSRQVFRYHRLTALTFGC